MRQRTLELGACIVCLFCTSVGVAGDTKKVTFRYFDKMLPNQFPPVFTHPLDEAAALATAQAYRVAFDDMGRVAFWERIQGKRTGGIECLTYQNDGSLLERCAFVPFEPLAWCVTYAADGSIKQTDVPASNCCLRDFPAEVARMEAITKQYSKP